MRTLVILDLKEAIVRTTGLLLRASRSDRFDDRKSLDRAMDWGATTVAVFNRVREGKDAEPFTRNLYYKTRALSNASTVKFRD